MDKPTFWVLAFAIFFGGDKLGVEITNAEFGRTAKYEI